MRLPVSEIPVDVTLVVASDPGDAGLLAHERRACSALPPHRRSDWRAGRFAARRAVASVLGLADAERIEIASIRGSAPRIQLRDRVSGSVRRLPLALSLTHRDGYAAAAVSPDGNRIGVDLEAVATVPCSYARYFLTQRERDITCLRDPTETWVLKEAAWKALGCDEIVPFTALGLEFDAQGAVTGVCLQGQTWPARAMLSNPWPGYVLGVFWSALPPGAAAAADVLRRRARGRCSAAPRSPASQADRPLRRPAPPRG